MNGQDPSGKSFEAALSCSTVRSPGPFAFTLAHERLSPLPDHWKRHGRAPSVFPCPGSILTRRPLQTEPPPETNFQWGLHGAPGRIRTCDLQIRSLLLYPAELRALAWGTT